jgi:hypothetical protein
VNNETTKQIDGCQLHVGYWSEVCGFCAENKLQMFNENMEKFWTLFGPANYEELMDPGSEADQAAGYMQDEGEAA